MLEPFKLDYCNFFDTYCNFIDSYYNFFDTYCYFIDSLLQLMLDIKVAIYYNMFGGDIVNRKKDLLYKPNQTIMSSNKDITAVQRKAYNVILQYAQKELRLDPEKRSFQFIISELKQRAGISATNNVELKESLKNLSSITVELVKDNGDWSVFSLLSQAEKNGDFLEIELPGRIRQALIENDYYTALDLLIIRLLEGKYAIILYEAALRYEKVQIPEFTRDEFRVLTGTKDIKSYDNFNLLKRKVIDPAIDEINSKTDILLSYDVKSRGRKVVAIKFHISKKKDIQEIESLMPNDFASKMDIELFEKDREYQRLIDELPESERHKKSVREMLDSFLNKHSYEILLKSIRYCNEKLSNGDIKKTYVGYLRIVLERGVVDELNQREIQKNREIISNIKKNMKDEDKRRVFLNYFYELSGIEQEDLKSFLRNRNEYRVFFYDGRDDYEDAVVDYLSFYYEEILTKYIIKTYKLASKQANL